jgi:hypothetical protein
MPRKITASHTRHGGAESGEGGEADEEDDEEDDEDEEVRSAMR